MNGDYEDLVDTFTVEANKAVEFRLLRYAEDVREHRESLPGQYDDLRKKQDIEMSAGGDSGKFAKVTPDTPFNPDMSHQIFGEKEQIWGYSDLKVKMWFGAGSLQQYYKLEYSDKVDAERHGIAAQDIRAKLVDQQNLQKDHLENLESFAEAIQTAEANFTPIGEKIHEFKRTGKDGNTKKFIITRATLANAGAKLMKYHERIQTFLLWFVDGASYIDDWDDDVGMNNWDFYFMFEVYDGDRYAIAGYATCYRFYAYPDKIRPRISQILVLPPFQRAGLGKELMDLIYREYNRADVIDMTVEDPSENFQRVRDSLDCTLLTKLPEFSKKTLLEKPKITVNQIEAARQEFKINRLQTIRVFDILLFHLAQLEPTKINYSMCKRLLIMRMWDHYVKSKRLRKAKMALQKQGQTSDTSDEEKMKQLAAEATDIIEEYERVLLRFKRNPIEHWK